MKKPITVCIAALAVTNALAANFDDYARVVDVRERYSNYTAPRTNRVVCDQNRQESSEYGAGTAIGAIAGGLIGSQVGKGNGRVAGAAVGAATGAMTGHYLEGRNRNQDQRCYQDYNETSYQRRPIGYTVTYEYAGRTFTENTTQSPQGNTIRVRVHLSPN